MRSFTIVFCGGAAGTFARHGGNDWLPNHDGWPVATFTVNLIGSFLLGLLLTRLALASTGAASGRRDLRLLLGTGFLGGFTTYSAFAVETQTLLRDGNSVMALGYAAATVVLGLVAALAGAITAREVGR